MKNRCHAMGTLASFGPLLQWLPKAEHTTRHFVRHALPRQQQRIHSMRSKIQDMESTIQTMRAELAHKKRRINVQAARTPFLEVSQPRPADLAGGQERKRRRRMYARLAAVQLATKMIAIAIPNHPQKNAIVLAMLNHVTIQVILKNWKSVIATRD
eukprot:3526273-Amphidinium_carterae.1